jgi:hypothetical protein
MDGNPTTPITTTTTTTTTTLPHPISKLRTYCANVSTPWFFQSLKGRNTLTQVLRGNIQGSRRQKTKSVSQLANPPH